MQERAKITRKKILQAAVNEFSAKGIDGARVDGIATKAGVNKQRIYAYFKNKNGLFEAALAAVFAEISIFPSKSINEIMHCPKRITEILMRDFMKIHANHPEFWRMLAWANLNDEVSLNLLRGICIREDAGFREAFYTAQRTGVLVREISYENYIFSLMAITFFYHSNGKTLSQTLSPEFFTENGREAMTTQINMLFGKV
ncbi:MAG: TetR/AcrR family transcriptional regulator [Lentisphaerae bacterium]|nr:TetR/AcrR family transcriptional regulator [Lentisphaerota bacterium]MCP4103526.1 TetR/AcrR family transcriptional regulator [Lentisphaerota bacterium]